LQPCKKLKKTKNNMKEIEKKEEKLDQTLVVRISYEVKEELRKEAEEGKTTLSRKIQNILTNHVNRKKELAIPVSDTPITITEFVFDKTKFFVGLIFVGILALIYFLINKATKSY
jgi:asparagine synthetase B (glutamine-hydrolysing)